MTKTLNGTLKARKRNSVAWAPIAAGMVAGSLVTGALLTAGFARSTISAETFRQLDLFGEVFEQVHANYVEPPEDALLIEGAIDGLLDKLDPHSNYLSAEDFSTMQEQTRGSFAGLGIQVVMDNEGPDKGYVKVVAPIEDTPAERAGIQTNDLIVEIDGAKVQGMSLDEAISKLKGDKGTSVTIAISRNRDADPFDVTLVRDIVKVEAVRSEMKGYFGYIRVRTFSETADEGVRDAMKELEKSIPGGPKGYVLDLRANPGGLLDQAVAVSDAFLEGGEIVSTRGRNARDTLREMGTRGDLAKGRPIIVLINGGSASASEIVAGALQDRKRALVLGTKSFGKGSVQTVIPLQNGLQGALRLTTARYYTPAGRSIQAMGIEPDIKMPVLYPGQEALPKARGEKDLPNALDVADDVKDDSDIVDEDATAKDDSTVALPEDGPEPVLCEAEKDCQLDRALEILADATAYRSLLAEAKTQ